MAAVESKLGACLLRLDWNVIVCSATSDQSASDYHVNTAWPHKAQGVIKLSTNRSLGLFIQQCMTNHIAHQDRSGNYDWLWSTVSGVLVLFHETMVSHVECLLRHRYHRICKPNFVKQKIALVVFIQITLGNRRNPQSHTTWRPETQQFFRCDGGIVSSASHCFSVDQTKHLDPNPPERYVCFTVDHLHADSSTVSVF